MTERGILLALCRRDSSPEAVAHLVAEIQRRGIGPAVRESAEANRVLDLIWYRLSQLRLLGSNWGFPDPATLRELYRSRCRMAMVIDLELERVLERFRAASIEPVLLKGAALRQEVYSASVERPMGDVDLLVAPDRFDAALELLGSLGYRLESQEIREAYRRHHYHFLALHPAGFTIELHWDLSRPGNPIQLDAPGVLSRARTILKKGRTPVRVPAPEDLILHAVEQALREAFGSLRHLVDVDRIVARAGAELDWLALRQRAARAGLTVALAQAARLSSRLLGTEIPPNGAPRLPPITRYHLDRLPAAPQLEGRPSLPTAQRLAGFWLLSGWRARTRAMLQVPKNQRDPMAWRWREVTGEAGSEPGRLDGLVIAFKNVIYQSGVSLGLVGRKPGS